MKSVLSALLSTTSVPEVAVNLANLNPDFLKSDFFQNSIKNLHTLYDFYQNPPVASVEDIKAGAKKIMQNPTQNWITCELCQGGTYLADYLLSQEWFIQPIEDVAIFVCEFELPDYACDGFVHNMAHPIRNSLLSFDLQPTFFCEEWVTMCPKTNWKKLEVEDYVKRVLADKPAKI